MISSIQTLTDSEVLGFFLETNYLFFWCWDGGILVVVYAASSIQNRHGLFSTVFFFVDGVLLLTFGVDNIGNVWFWSWCWHCWQMNDFRVVVYIVDGVLLTFCFHFNVFFFFFLMLWFWCCSYWHCLVWYLWCHRFADLMWCKEGYLFFWKFIQLYGWDYFIFCFEYGINYWSNLIFEL